MVCERWCVTSQRMLTQTTGDATQNDGGCDIVPRLPRETKVDVRLCHACHAKCRGVPGDQAGPSAPPSAICPTPATQNDGGCDIVPRLPPSAICPTPATQNDGGCDIVPRLPRETKVDVRLCHACHAKCRGVTGAQSRPKRATQYHKCHACHAKRQ